MIGAAMVACSPPTVALNQQALNQQARQRAFQRLRVVRPETRGAHTYLILCDGTTPAFPPKLRQTLGIDDGQHSIRKYGRRIMTPARLTELPPPPSDENTGWPKTGWPWTEETPPVPPLMANGAPWPRISIVTPSYNQGAFIEETIRSVLLQGYPNLEYVILDGGSSDDSTSIIRKYEPWLAHWASERDRGQAHAINKGLDM
jgi:hypothetical protein